MCISSDDKALQAEHRSLKALAQGTLGGDIVLLGGASSSSALSFSGWRIPKEGQPALIWQAGAESAGWWLWQSAQLSKGWEAIVSPDQNSLAIAAPGLSTQVFSLQVCGFPTLAPPFGCCCDIGGHYSSWNLMYAAEDF